MHKRTFIIILMFFVIAEPVLLSQSNHVTNGSFEWNQNLPLSISVSDDPNGLEVTRCLGDWYPNYPIRDDRYKTKQQGGCDGWYDPSAYISLIGTPDYYNRGVNFNDNNQKKVSVPHNKVNNYGINVNHKQEPYDYDPITNPNENAYVGIYNVRMLSAAPTSTDHHAEYITQRLGTPLEAHKIYNVSFRISWTNEGEQDVDRQTGHYLNKMYAYFTNGKFEQSGALPVPVSLNNPHLAKTKRENDDWLDEHGGADGTNWMLVNAIIQPSEQLNFITIGNFQQMWEENVDFAGPAIPNDTRIRVYYFIDSVVVTEIPNFVCSCSHLTIPAYSLILKQKLREPGSNECCFDLFLDVKYDYRICQVNRAVIKKVNIEPPYDETVVDEFESNGEYFHHLSNPIHIYDNLCYTDAMGLQKKIKVELYNGDELKCTVEKEFVVNCDCACETEPTPDYFLDIELINYSHEITKQECCYDIAIIYGKAPIQFDCNFSFEMLHLEVDESSSNNLTLDIDNPQFILHSVSNNNGKTVYSIKNLYGIINHSTDNVIGRLCATWSSGPISAKITYENEEGLCDREWEFNINCEDCCDKIDVNIPIVPVWDDGTQCCFELDIDIDVGFLCGIQKVRIFNSANSECLWESFDAIPDGGTTFIFCLQKESFGGLPSLNLDIKFYLESMDVLCTKNAIVLPCNNLAEPCTPDRPDVAWLGPKKGFKTFTCPPPPTPPIPCYIQFTYKYRHVKDQNNESVHRDIQVLNYNFNYICNCDLEKIKQMLEIIWSDPDVINEFELDDDNWSPNEIRCFTNFRVITSDCWQEMAYTDINGTVVQFRSKCPGMECCYSQYKVCYKKESGQIKYIENSYEQQLFEPGPTQPCVPPCSGTNCPLWAITNPVVQKLSFNTEEKSNDCKVYISSNIGDSYLNLNIECSLNGKIKYQIADLVGNVVEQNEFEKNNYKVSRQLSDNLSSGLYFVRIIINNELIYYNKISVIK